MLRYAFFFFWGSKLDLLGKNKIPMYVVVPSPGLLFLICRKNGLRIFILLVYAMAELYLEFVCSFASKSKKKKLKKFCVTLYPLQLGFSFHHL